MGAWKLKLARWTPRPAAVTGRTRRFRLRQGGRTCPNPGGPRSGQRLRRGCIRTTRIGGLPAVKLLSEVSINLDTGGRPALNEQLDRLQQATEDPALALGSAKDLLEAVAKFVLSELDWPIAKKADYGELWYFARERLNILPQQVAGDAPGANHIKAVLQNAWAIADQINALRNLQGTGHGRTLPTGVTAELARLVVREACSVAEFTLTSLDRAKGNQS
jgi:hypothetical protein